MVQRCYYCIQLDPMDRITLPPVRTMSTGHQAASSGTETHNFGGAGSEEPLADCEGLLSSIKSACSILESSHLPELEKLFRCDFSSLLCVRAPGSVGAY